MNDESSFGGRRKGEEERAWLEEEMHFGKKGWRRVCRDLDLVGPPQVSE
jgi:hypothetical protein